ncbi:MAG TPA: hypothetical protein VF715_03595 [Thermoleophilaceae bacterium]
MIAGALARAVAGERAPRLLALAAGLAAIPVWIYLTRDRTFAIDEWPFVADRWRGGLDTALERHNEHIVVIPALIYRLLFETVGIDQAWPYRLVVLAMHLGCAAFLFALVRRRAGAWPAAFAAILLLFCARGSENVLHAFQMGFVGPVLGGLAAWWALDRERPAVACAALVLGVLCGSLAVAIALGVAAELLWARRARLLWVPAAPLALYALWRVGYGPENATRREGWEAAPGWAVDAASAAAGGVLGRGLDYGRPLLLLAIAVVVWRFRAAPVTPRLAGVVCAGAAYWLLTGSTRSSGAVVPQDPDQSRYVYLGVIVVLLVLAECARGWRPGPRGVAALAVLTLLGLLQGVPELRREAAGWRGASDRVRAEATALHAVRPRVPAGFELADGLGDISAADYFRAADRFGSVALPIEELRREPAPARHFADRVFVAIDARLVPAGPGEAGAAGRAPAPVTEAGGGAGMRTRGGCLEVREPVQVRPASPALLVRGGAAVHVDVWRIGDDPQALGDVPARGAAAVRLVPDAIGVPWHVRLTPAGGAPVTVCSLG